MKKHPLLIASFLCALASFGKQSIIDSLFFSIQSGQEDTNQVNTLNLLSGELWLAGNYDSSLIYSTKAQVLAEKLGYKKGLAKAYTYIGVVHIFHGNYPKAMEYHLKSLSISQEIGDKLSIARNLNNIAGIHNSQGNSSKALEYYSKTMSIYHEIGNKYGIAMMLIVSGSQYYKDGDYSKAKEHYLRALDVGHEINNTQIITAGLEGIGQYYKAQSNYDSALVYHQKALLIFQKSGYKEGIAGSHIMMGDIYIKQGNFKAARETLINGLLLSKKIRALTNVRDAYKSLSILDSIAGNFKAEIENYKNYVTYRDSLVNSENTRKEMNYEFVQKQLADSLRVAEERKVADANIKYEQTKGYALYGGLAIVIVFAGFMFNRFKVTQKQKSIIAKQKLVVDEKNRNITDSISYAQLIQNALLLPESDIVSAFSDAFVLLLPRDIVSGDFYWYEETGTRKMLAVADCTGHGVPGGFMSMLGYEMLQEILPEENIRDTGDALNRLNRKLTETLNKRTQSRDGMDMALLSVSKETNRIQYSGANRPLLQVSGNVLTHHYPDKFGLGGDSERQDKVFTTNNIEAKKGDVFYMYSDGYADQFGGPEGKKFMHRHLTELLVSINQMPLSEQKQVLLETIRKWKGPLEQTDDVLVVGIRI